MRKLLRYLGAGKREQLESDSKETTAELRVRTAHEKQERDKSPATSINVDASGDAELQVSEFYTQLKRVTPYAFVTPALVLINDGVFAAMIAGGVDLMSPSIEHLLSWGPNFAPKTTGGEWWRLLTESWIDSEKGADGYQINHPLNQRLPSRVARCPLLAQGL